VIGVRLSVPLVIEFGGLYWPYGPVRLALRSSEREGALSVLRAGPHTLLVDPSLPAPASDEGPLSAAAAALRAHSPATALEVVFEGPRPPYPGAEVAGLFGLREILSGGDSSRPEDPAACAVRTGLAVTLTGAPASVSDERVAWCESSLLLVRDPAAQEAPTPPTRGAAPGLFEATSLSEWAAGVTGQGLDAPSSAREADLFEALRAAGLLARWPLGGGVLLFLTRDTLREALIAALGDHGFELWPMTFGGVQGFSLLSGGENS
jgi:hypothetical protein